MFAGLYFSFQQSLCEIKSLRIIPFHFSGGFEEYFCGNEENYFTALDHFGRSRVAGIQMSFYTLSNHIVVSLWVVHSFNTFCVLARYFFFHLSGKYFFN